MNLCLSVVCPFCFNLDIYLYNPFYNPLIVKYSIRNHYNFKDSNITFQSSCLINYSSSI